ncbi:MAG: hypothetical protein JW833_11220 [Prolixibacteraceae bacterium]|nr:hypothetical protein [Prolixibacteraceae bacterium]
MRKDSEGNYIKEGLYTSWYMNGQKKCEKTYVNGKIEGKSIYWFENGQKEEESNFINDSLDGLQIMWYENGQKKQEGIYKSGNLIGSYKEWYENGQLKEQWTDEDKSTIATIFKTQLKGSVCYKDAILRCLTVDGVDKASLKDFMNMVASTTSETFEKYGSCEDDFTDAIDQFFFQFDDKAIGNKVIQGLITEGYLINGSKAQ